MSAITEIAVNEFAWEVQPAAARWVQRAIDSLVARNPNIPGGSDFAGDFKTYVREAGW